MKRLVLFLLLISIVVVSGCVGIKEITKDITKPIEINHTYTICKQKSWDGILRVKILGTNTYLESEDKS